MARTQNGSSRLAERTLALVMAGGNGSRLGELTRFDCKPALPFGGHCRNVDFALSNCVNSGVRRVAVLTQYKAHSLIQHVQQGWSFLRPELGEFVQVWPAQQRRGKNWYAGTADSIYQNIELIERIAPERVLILAGDHVYRMDYLAMLEAHVAAGLGCTVACAEVPLVAASGFGVLRADEHGRVRHFAEKPSQPTPHAARPDMALASMGIYVFDRHLLIDCLEVDAEDAESAHDFGQNILPLLVRSHGLAAYAFREGNRPGYWRDIGTIDNFWQANLDLVADAPPLDLHDREWPIYTLPTLLPPARFVGAGVAERSIVAAGSTIAGRLDECVVSADCVVEEGALVTRSVLLPGVKIGRHCRIERAIVDAGCVVPDRTVIGEDRMVDASCYDVSPTGVALVTTASLRRASAARQRVA
jgi:glucose-1-phosphate adenylyltransferase